MRAWLLLAFCLVSATGKADASPYLARENPLLALLPSAPALHARERERLEAQLAHALAGLSRVKRAEVVLTLPDLARLPLDQPAPTPSANILLEVIEAGPGDQDVVELVRAALPEIDSGRVHIVRTRWAARALDSVQAGTPRASPLCARDAPSGMVRVGPFVVASESSVALRASLAVCLAANVLLAALLLMRRRAR